jgi:RimJ/RimL family protein N-acetyltransferase
VDDSAPLATERESERSRSAPPRHCGRMLELQRVTGDAQDAGICVFFVLVDRNGSIVGRFNIYDLENGAAEVGYRVAEQVAGQGVATEALASLCRKAATDHGLRTLTAGTSTANVASQRVLEKAGFVSTGTCRVGGEPCLKFTVSLADVPSEARASGTTNHQPSAAKRDMAAPSGQRAPEGEIAQPWL